MADLAIALQKLNQVAILLQEVSELTNEHRYYNTQRNLVKALDAVHNTQMSLYRERP